jgi:hypothetical protein
VYRHLLALIVFAICGRASTAGASFDELSDERLPPTFSIGDESLRLVLKGEAELELHDIEGQGGVGFDSPTDTRTIGTRSPFVELDSFWLALRLSLGPYLKANSVLEFSPRGSLARSVWFEAQFTAWATHRLELGFNIPFVAIDRRTERYPLVASVYWRESEMHLTYEAQLALTSSTSVEAGVSLAFMRPLGFSGVQESQSQTGVIRVLAYAPARPFSGNAPVLGARAKLLSHGAFAELFGFLGSLSAEGGTDELRNNFARLGATDLDTTAYWAGARVGANVAGAHLLVEGIVSRESVLLRYGGYVQLSYELQLSGTRRLLHSIEPLVRYEIYRIGTANEPSTRFRSSAPSDAITWDFDVTTFAVFVGVYRHHLLLRLELYLVAEHNGAPEFNEPTIPLRNDEFLAQLELRF